MTLASQSCNLPAYVDLRVELVGGCARLIQARPRIAAAGPGPEMQFLTCFASTLANVRVACAGAQACALFEYDTLP
jgi:hypothetical protein